MKIGCDITKIQRLQNISPAFVEKYFCESEIEYAKGKKDMAETLAGIFCAKEAVFKTFGTVAFPKLKDIEITHQQNIPAVRLHGKYACFGKVEVSISHDGEYAISYALREETAT